MKTEYKMEEKLKLLIKEVGVKEFIKVLRNLGYRPTNRKKAVRILSKFITDESK